MRGKQDLSNAVNMAGELWLPKVVRRRRAYDAQATHARKRMSNSTLWGEIFHFVHSAGTHEKNCCLMLQFQIIVVRFCATVLENPGIQPKIPSTNFVNFLPPGKN